MIWGCGFQVPGYMLRVSGFGSGWFASSSVAVAACSFLLKGGLLVPGCLLHAQFHLLVAGLRFYVASYSCLFAENGLLVKCCSVTRVGRCYNV